VGAGLVGAGLVGAELAMMGAGCSGCCSALVGAACACYYWRVWLQGLLARVLQGACVCVLAVAARRAS
jgi:hypothetical protein